MLTKNGSYSNHKLGKWNQFNLVQLVSWLNQQLIDKLDQFNLVLLVLELNQLYSFSNNP